VRAAAAVDRPVRDGELLNGAPVPSDPRLPLVAGDRLDLP
jgi:hypothetical protein